MALVDTLARTEEAFWTSGADYYREHLASEFLLVFPGVGFLGREEMIEGVENGQRWDRATLSDLELNELSDTSAALSYAVRAQREGDDGPTSFKALVSSVYVREGGGWKLSLHHQTPTG